MRKHRWTTFNEPPDLGLDWETIIWCRMLGEVVKSFFGPWLKKFYHYWFGHWNSRILLRSWDLSLQPSFSIKYLVVRVSCIPLKNINTIASRFFALVSVPHALMLLFDIKKKSIVAFHNDKYLRGSLKILSNKIKLLSVSLYTTQCSLQWNAKLFFFIFFYFCWAVCFFSCFYFLYL
jgi:hypothetical protein